jgi:hypothetical protein
MAMKALRKRGNSAGPRAIYYRGAVNKTCFDLNGDLKIAPFESGGNTVHECSPWP